jgi:hypothetical protein
VVWHEIRHAPQDVVDALYSCVALLPCLLIWADVLLKQQDSAASTGTRSAAHTPTHALICGHSHALEPYKDQNPPTWQQQHEKASCCCS